MADAIERTLMAAAAGTAQNFPKTGKALPDGRLFQSMMAIGIAPPAPEMAAIKMVGLSPANTARGLPHIGGIIVLMDGGSGMPIAIMDATWITEARTAALSLVAARRYARPKSCRIGLIACGGQAKAHLHVFREAFPLLSVTAYSRSRSSAEALAARAREMGLEARVTENPRLAVADQDIVVTSVPDAPGLAPFLRAEWLSPGAFAAVVDTGRSWRPEGFEDIECKLVDDRAQAIASASYRKLTPAGPYAADLIDLVKDPRLQRQSDGERAVFTCQGMAISDLAAAALVLERAESRGIGTLLPA